MGAVIDILDAGGMAKVCCPGAGLEALLLSQGAFVIEEEPQPFGMIERAGLRIGLERLLALGHAMQAERVQEIEGRVCQHRGLRQWK